MKRQSHKVHKVITASLLAVVIMSAHAASFVSQAEISQAVEHFVMQQRVPLNNIQVKITSFTDEIKLNRCLSPLEISMAPGTKLLGNTSLAVSCTYPQKWKIHVAAHVDGEVSALIARHPITRGTILQNTDFEFSTRRYSQLYYGYYASANQIQGMEAKRNIKMGQVLTPGLLRAQKLVLRGQSVIIVAQSAGLDLRVKGKALMDGRQGQTIQVKNLSSQKLIYAQVVANGMVKVNF